MLNPQRILMAGGVLLMAVVIVVAGPGNKEDEDKPVRSKAEKAPALAFTVKDIDGRKQDLRQYKGKVVMIVNVASECGLTPQYEGLQALYEKYKDKGFVVLGFPANEFGAQEPGSEESIKQGVCVKYKVTFPMFSKVVVKGEEINPLFKYLTDSQSGHKHGGEIKWNFNKFLIDRHGRVVDRFEPRVKPEDKKVIDAIEKALDEDTRSGRTHKPRP